MCDPSFRPPPPIWEVGPHPLPPHMQSRGGVEIALQPSLKVQREKVRVGLLPLPPPALLDAKMKKHGQRRQRYIIPPIPGLGVGPWDT